MRRLLAQLTYWYYRLTGRCVICGGSRADAREGIWQCPSPYACRWCNKRIQHGMNYGMSRRGFQRASR